MFLSFLYAKRILFIFEKILNYNFFLYSYNSNIYMCEFYSHILNQWSDRSNRFNRVLNFNLILD